MRRTAIVLVSSVLLLGLVGAAPGAADPGGARGGQVPTEAGATDPRGDARGGSRAARRLADLTSARFSAPGRPDGLFTASARFTRVTGARTGPRQYVAVELRSPNRQRQWLVFANTSAREVRIIENTPDGTRRIEPDRSSVSVRSGGDGRITMRVSTEWLPTNRGMIRVGPAFAVYREADDTVRFRTRLDMSGTGETVVVEPVPPTQRVLAPSSCRSHYDVLATAPTWPGLRTKLRALDVYGVEVDRIRVQSRGTDVGVGDKRSTKVIDLLDDKGRRLVQGEVWRTQDGRQRAGVWSQCID